MLRLSSIKEFGAKHVGRSFIKISLEMLILLPLRVLFQRTNHIGIDFLLLRKKENNLYSYLLHQRSTLL